MKKPWLWMLLAGSLGVAAAWGINHYRYGVAMRFGRYGTADGADKAVAVNQVATVETKSGNPKAVVSDGKTTHDFGIMTPGSKGEQTFQIENRGESDLILRLGASTCKCTVGSLQNDAVAPGEKTSVKLSWTIKPDDVAFSQSAQILTNDPTAPALSFAITGKVVRDIDVVPETWSFGDVVAGESFEVAGTIYNFMQYDIEPTEPSFTIAEMSDLTEFTVEPFEPSEQTDGVRSVARQGFRVRAKVKPGMRQGALSPKLVFRFRKLDRQGEAIIEPRTGSDDEFRVSVPVSGTIVGPLSMILNESVKELSGSYLFDLGRIGKNDPLTSKAFVVLKGNERDNTELRIGEVSPDGVIRATLGEPKGSGPTKLFPLEIQLLPSSESVERKGLNKDDYGWIWIESDNPKVARMRVALKFSLEGR